MRLKGIVTFLALFAAFVFCVSCSQQQRGDSPAASEPGAAAATPEVDVTRVAAQKLNATVKLPAQLMPYEVVDVHAKVTGFVKWIKVDRGSRVKEGEQIAQLEAPEFVAQRAEAESKFQSAESQLSAGQAKLTSDQSTYQRLNSAAKTPGVVALNDLNVAQKAVEADEANVRALGKSAQAAQEAVRAVSQLEAYLSVIAPFDGQVTTRYVHPGALVGPAGGPGAMTPIVQIQALNRLRLVVPVPEYEAAGIREGAEVSFTVPSFPGRIFRAPIARISHSVDIKTRTMQVELDVRDPRAELQPGTFSEVFWPVHRDYSTLFVPASAVASDLERTFVIRVRNNQTEWVDVQTGSNFGKLVEVFGNLAEGDAVAVRGTDQLRSGTLVTPRQVRVP